MRNVTGSLFIALSLLLPVVTQGHTLGQGTEISILTCSPGRDVHAFYGHSAIRVKDTLHNLDLVFNYGVFSFHEPGFVYRFAKGQTWYMVDVSTFERFVSGYIFSRRSVTEQVLDISMEDKQRIWDFLNENIKPENSKYLYNFFLNNCATRLRDAVVNNTDGSVVFPAQGQDKTFRQLIHQFQKIMPWINLGIHLVVGSPSDRVATVWQEMFLPELLMEHFGEARLVTDAGERPLVSITRVIHDSGVRPGPPPAWSSPTAVLSVCLLLIVVISIYQLRKKKISYLPDYLLLFITGLIGLILMWFVMYSEHPAMHPNFNLLWAVPLNFIFAIVWMKKKWRSWSRWYWPALAAWLILFLLLHFLIPQAFYFPLYLLMVMMLCRAAVQSVRILLSRN